VSQRSPRPRASCGSRTWFHTLVFYPNLNPGAQEDTAGARSFFSEIISSISDLRFSRDGRHLLARDYMTLKLWRGPAPAPPLLRSRANPAECEDASAPLKS